MIDKRTAKELLCKCEIVDYFNSTNKHPDCDFYRKLKQEVDSFLVEAVAGSLFKQPPNKPD